MGMFAFSFPGAEWGLGGLGGLGVVVWIVPFGCPLRTTKRLGGWGLDWIFVSSF
jgi:hypothetical protein